MGQPTTTAGAAPGEHRARLRVLRDFVTHPGTWLLPMLVFLFIVPYRPPRTTWLPRARGMM